MTESTDNTSADLDLTAIPSRRQLTVGPVTLAMQVARRRDPWFVAFALRAWPAIPPLFMIAYHGTDFTAAVSSVLGYDATLCLVGCITITPLLTLAKATWAAKLRWWYGIWMFVLGGALFVIALLAGMGDPGMALAGSFTLWTGTLIVVLLLPMAITANVTAQRLLGPEWKRWQRWLMWAVWWATAVHFAAMGTVLALLGLLAATGPLGLLRSPDVRKSVKDWRSDRYSAGWWWFWLAILGSCWLAGVVILLAETGQACATAITGN